MSLLRVLRDRLRGHETGKPSAPADPMLPRGSHLAVTWTIPDDYGGMTSALLRRSRAFARDTGEPVQILTFDPALDAARARARLRTAGELDGGVTLHHLWEDLAAWPDDALGVAPDAEPRTYPRVEDGRRSRSEVDDDGALVRRWHFRPDGTLAAVEKVRRRGRLVRVYDRAGRPGRRWTSIWHLYADWMDGILPPGPAYVVVDSKSMVRPFARLERPDTAVAHVVHGAHLSGRADDALGPLSPSRRPFVRHLDDFDAVVLLTEGQRRDLLQRVGPRDHVHVVPNSTDLPQVAPDRARDRGAGAVVAQLSDRKQVDQAVAGYALAAERTGARMHLDVYGDGPRRAEVEAAARRTTGVRLHGYVPRAADRLAKASYLLLTSRSEGLPLVLAEAMSRGCLPIVYDVRYGPADFITDGVDGFLVPDGDVEGIADRLERLLSLDEDDVRRMRHAARATAEQYADGAVVARWAQVFRSAAARAEGRHRTATTATAD
ncbi:glycosyltransferase [Isoptericola halotolerans]|uniref:glycosyltransferase n=1 Tax=Isoptericola halotolerans TaxID=300560 RepID=UPI00388E1723